MRKTIRKRLIQPVLELSESGKLSGILLLICTVISLTVANTSQGDTYLNFWQSKFGFSFLSKTIEHWINDGLMAVFFFLVGLEIKREILKGELSTVKSSLLPVIAAAGGVIIPSSIFLLITNGTIYSNGWAIPAATDIAFSLGILTMLGKKIPFSLKIFLTALAIIDDLAAILFIAFFYTASLNLLYLAYGLISVIILFLFNKFKIKIPLLYLLFGILLWYFILKSGIHATIAGVILAFTIPLSNIEKLEHALVKPVSYFILPLFALVNTAIPVDSESIKLILSQFSLAVILGLFIGKPLGITLFTYVSKKLKLVTISDSINFRHILGLGFIAGIGFTMSIFISNLSFDDKTLIDQAKLAVLTGSLLSAVCGALILNFGSKEKNNADQCE